MKKIFRVFISKPNCEYFDKYFSSKVEALKEIEKITAALEFLGIQFSEDEIGYVEISVVK